MGVGSLELAEPSELQYKGAAVSWGLTAVTGRLPHLLSAAPRGRQKQEAAGGVTQGCDGAR